MKRRENNSKSLLTWSALAGVTMLVASPALAQDANRGPDPETRMKAAVYDQGRLIHVGHGEPPFDVEEQQSAGRFRFRTLQGYELFVPVLDVGRGGADEPTDIGGADPRLDLGILNPGGQGGVQEAQAPGAGFGDPDSIADDRDEDPDPTQFPEMFDIARVVDMWYILTFWGTDDPNADLNGDGVVDVIDLLLSLAEDPDPEFDVRDLLWYLAQRTDEFTPEESNDYHGPDIFIPLSDLMWRIIEMWGTSDKVADVNQDGIVDMFDFIQALRMQRLTPYSVDALIDYISDLVDGPHVIPGMVDTLTTLPDRPDHNLYTVTTPDDEAPTDLGPAEECPFDCANDDGIVDSIDLLRLLSEWGTPGPHDCDVASDAFEPQGDGVVDVNDILSLLTAWGKCS